MSDDRPEARSNIPDSSNREGPDRDSSKPESPKPAFDIGLAVFIGMFWGLFVGLALYGIICGIFAPGDEIGPSCDGVLLGAMMIVTPITALIVFCIRLIIYSMKS